MPIYEFLCEKCKNTFEELAKMSDVKSPPCPNCGSKETRKLLSIFQSRSSGSPGKSSASCGGNGGGFS